MIIGAVLIVGGVYILMQDSAPATGTENPSTEQVGTSMPTGETPSDSGASTQSPEATGGEPGGITMAMVATHNTASSCWTVIDGSVYDVTSWISQHPGGARAITQLCGTDGTALFEGQHAGGQRQAEALAGMKIGVLVR